MCIAEKNNQPDVFDVSGFLWNKIRRKIRDKSKMHKAVTYRETFDTDVLVRLFGKQKLAIYQMVNDSDNYFPKPRRIWERSAKMIWDDKDNVLNRWRERTISVGHLHRCKCTELMDDEIESMTGLSRPTVRKFMASNGSTKNDVENWIFSESNAKLTFYIPEDGKFEARINTIRKKIHV